MSDDHYKKESTEEAPKILTLKELLAKKKQNMVQSKTFPGQHNNSTQQSKKGKAAKGNGHSHRSHRPQGG